MSHQTLRNAIEAANSGNVDLAVETFSLALTEAPSEPLIHRSYAVFLLSQGMVLDALIHFERAFTLDPKDRETSLQYAKVLMELARVERAQLVLDRYFNSNQQDQEVALIQNKLREQIGKSSGPLAVKYGESRLGNVACIHPGRCGSTVIGNMLGQHSMICWTGESLTRLKFDWKALAPYTDSLGLIQAQTLAASSPFFGFETKWSPPRDESDNQLSWRTYFEFLDRLGYQYFIVIKRNNLLRHLASQQVSRLKNLWHVRSIPSEPTKIEIPLNVKTPPETVAVPLVDYLDEFSKWAANVYQGLDGKPLLKLCYEDDIEHFPLAAFERICNFLGLEPEPVRIEYKRQNPWPLPEIVKNWKEVYDTLKNTDHAWMLDG